MFLKAFGVGNFVECQLNWNFFIELRFINTYISYFYKILKISTYNENNSKLSKNAISETYYTI